MLLTLATGLRCGELLAFRWRNVDLAASVLAVVASLEETRNGLRIKDPKTPASRRQVVLPAIRRSQ